MWTTSTGTFPSEVKLCSKYIQTQQWHITGYTGFNDVT